MSIWHHFVRLGGPHDLLNTAINIGGATLVGWLPWRRHRQAQKTIADRLDTTTPGGLGDLVDGKARP